MTVPFSELDVEVAAIVAELQRAIQAKFPDASFDLRIAPDGRVFLNAYTEAENDFDVIELVAERTVDAMIQRGQIVHVFPRRRHADVPPNC